MPPKHFRTRLHKFLADQERNTHYLGGWWAGYWWGGVGWLGVGRGGASFVCTYLLVLGVGVVSGNGEGGSISDYQPLIRLGTERRGA